MDSEPLTSIHSAESGVGLPVFRHCSWCLSVSLYLSHRTFWVSVWSQQIRVMESGGIYLVIRVLDLVQLDHGGLQDVSKHCGSGSGTHALCVPRKTIPNLSTISLNITRHSQYSAEGVAVLSPPDHGPCLNHTQSHHGILELRQH